MVAIPRPNAIVLQTISDQLYRDSPPATVRIGLWVVAQRIKMCQVVADRGECFLLLPPGLGKVDLASCGSAHTFEDGARDRIQLGLACADHVNRDALRLGQLGYILGRDHASVVL